MNNFFFNFFIVILLIALLLKKCHNQDLNLNKSISSEQIDSSSTEIYTKIYKATCLNCGKVINGYGYKMIFTEKCIKCEIENSIDCSFCSEDCGLEYDKKSDAKYNKILNEYGYDSIKSTKNSRNNVDKYNVGSDGMIYEQKKCSLCSGTGIESNIATEEVQSRICPMCQGRGVKSY